MGKQFRGTLLQRVVDLTLSGRLRGTGISHQQVCTALLQTPWTGMPNGINWRFYERAASKNLQTAQDEGKNVFWGEKKTTQLLLGAICKYAPDGHFPKLFGFNSHIHLGMCPLKNKQTKHLESPFKNSESLSHSDKFRHLLAAG